MCCFSRPVLHVAKTHIFARRTQNGRQFLAYQMQYESQTPNAMILPLPVARPAKAADAASESKSPDRASTAPLVEFIDLQSYPEFFTDLDKVFPKYTGGGGNSRGGGAAQLRDNRILPVEIIGNFVASFVPTMDDFKRLDPQFVLPPRTWSQIPEYADYGFAVFQLKPGRGGVHPIALSFASRFDDYLFFPTLHIHDGQIHPTEHFDHDLYWQLRPAATLLRPHSAASAIVGEVNGRRSAYPMGKYMNAKRTKGLLDGNLQGYSTLLDGLLENRDTFVADRA